MKYCLFVIVWWMICMDSAAQQNRYTTANAHSHNDYEQAIPFYAAWNKQFGSIEADIFLHEGKLVVAHDSSQLSRKWTLDSLYLLPLTNCIAKNAGHVYADTTRGLQLMIDIKSEAVAALNKLMRTLEDYPSLIHASSLKIVISGNRPPAADFASYPAWIRFDGDVRKDYQPDELKKIEMLSDNFVRYTLWRGNGLLPEKDSLLIKQYVDKAHRLGKKIRFWNAPDNPESWKVLMELGVDYINTDEIEGLSRFLQK